MKLIEVNRAKEFASTLFGDPVLKMAVNAVLDKAPEFELVRCKDCKRYKENTEARTRFCRRELGYMYAKPDGFCSYGERKIDETD